MSLNQSNITSNQLDELVRAIVQTVVVEMKDPQVFERADDSPDSLDSLESNPAIPATPSSPSVSTRIDNPAVIENSNDYWMARAIAQKIWGQNWYVMDSKLNNRGIMYQVKYIPDLRKYMATGKLDDSGSSHTNFIWKKPDNSWLVLNPRTQSWKIAIPAKPSPIDALHERNIGETYEPKSERSKDFWTAQKIGETLWGKLWYVTQEKTSENGTVYLMKHQVPRDQLMSFVKTGKGQRPDSRLIWKTPSGQWKTFNPETKEWDIAIPSPSESITNEMTTTGAVAAVNVPAAFSKRKIKMSEGKNQDPTREEMIEYLQYVFSGLLDRPTFNDAAESAMYWFANFYHGGQSSNLYSVLSTSPYRPGPMEREPKPDSIESDMFSYLAQEFAGKSVTEGDESDAVNAMWAGSDDDLKGYELFSKRKRPAIRKPKRGKKIQASSAKVFGKGISLKEGYSTETIYKDRQGGRDVYWINNRDSGGKVFIKPEVVGKYIRQGYRLVDLADADKPEVNEMTTTGDVSGYNVPSAFARKGGSKKGVEGSAALGYTLTSIGQQEMNRQGDRLLESTNKQINDIATAMSALKAHVK